MEAQVTIGLNEEPVSGAILQLKSEEVSGNQPNAVQGLMLPRVSFDVDNSATATTADKLKTSLRLTISENVDAAVHTGLTVYNVETKNTVAGSPFAESKICPGVYVWDGTQWIRAMSTDCL